MKKIVLDIETKNDVIHGGIGDPTSLDVSVVCIHDSDTNEYISFTEEEFGKLWPHLEKADLLIGYNSDHFDIPILNKYYQGDLTHIKSIDLLVAVKDSLGRRLKLDTIAEATLGKKKIGHGLQAITWWKQGEIDKIREYCIEDVRITKEIYDYALEHGVLKYKDRGEIHDIQIDTTGWEEAKEHSMTHTLPF